MFANVISLPGVFWMWSAKALVMPKFNFCSVKILGVGDIMSIKEWSLLCCLPD